MEIKSEPKYETVHLTEINVSYPGEVRTLTLEVGKDSYTTCDSRVTDVTASDIVVTFGAGEVVTLEARNRNWYSIRPYTNRRVVKKETPHE